MGVDDSCIISDHRHLGYAKVVKKKTSWFTDFARKAARAVEPRQLLKRYVEQGHLGIESGKGFYSDYEEGAVSALTQSAHSLR
jgi:3-hydroxyacyl-CoA dehydrogenase